MVSFTLLYTIYLEPWEQTQAHSITDPSLHLKVKKSCLYIFILLFHARSTWTTGCRKAQPVSLLNTAHGSSSSSSRIEQISHTEPQSEFVVNFKDFYTALPRLQIN
ncbi:hypothetical protein AMECASPLE_031498 [Ameca splendens]|uniref:Uncharacterized protein n=1 Tax=Ameca splendens TaxID=208324 RepID=A0ABV0ZRU6_9TELE